MFRVTRKGRRTGLGVGPSTRRVRQDRSAQDSFGRWCELCKLPPPVKNYGFPRRKFPNNARRKWRIDWAWPDLGLMVEIQGGVWVRGAHAHPLDILRNFEKQNDGALLGYRFLQFTPEEVRSGHAVATVEAWLGAWGGAARARAQPPQGGDVVGPLFGPVPGSTVVGSV